MKSNGFFGKIAAFISSIGNWFNRNSTGWKRNSKGMIRETHPNAQRGCSRPKNYQPGGHANTKGAFGSSRHTGMPGNPGSKLIRRMVRRNGGVKQTLTLVQGLNRGKRFYPGYAKKGSRTREGFKLTAPKGGK